MPIKIDPRFVGRAWITPEGPVVAGEYGTWTFTYEVGAYGYDERARPDLPREGRRVAFLRRSIRHGALRAAGRLACDGRGGWRAASPGGGGADDGAAERGVRCARKGRGRVGQSVRALRRRAGAE